VREGNRIKGEVTAIDHYGTVSLNISEKLFRELGLKRGAELLVLFKNKKVKIKWVATYGEVSEGEGLLLISSTGFMDLAVNKGSAAEKYGLELGEVVILEKLE
jgi:S-adenosylmethionine hydrolase